MTGKKPSTGRRTGDAEREEKLRALHEQLAQQVADLHSGADWQRWLAAAARFHSYSFGNTLLILAQRPDATAVAGYQTWKHLGRQVTKGEKGIAILAPVIRRPGGSTGADGQDSQDVAPVDVVEPASPRPGTSGAPPAGEGTPARATRRVSGFRPTYVFDVSQTTGEPLPEPPAPELLAGEAPAGLWDALAGQVAAAGYDLERGPCDGANGVTTPATRTVRVRDDIDDAQAVKTLAHELAHVLLHTHRPAPPNAAGDPVPAPGPERASAGQEADELQLVCRGVGEVEAESVAYLVTAAYGLDSSVYTFPYVTTWADGVQGQTAQDVVRSTGERVLAAARQITSAIAAHTDHAGLAEVAQRAALGQQVVRAVRAESGIREPAPAQAIHAERHRLLAVQSPAGPPRPPAASLRRPVVAPRR